MDKKTILGIVVVAALFLGFAYFNISRKWPRIRPIRILWPLRRAP